MMTGSLRELGTSAPDRPIVGSLLPASDGAALEAEWDDLARDAVEPNPFYSPALLIPALASYADDQVRLATVRDGRGRLIAFAPVAPMRGYSRLPVSYVATWMHPHCFFAAPLIRRGAEREALRALFDLLDAEGSFLRLRHLGEDGKLFAAARAAAEEAGRLCAPSARYRRAALYGGFDARETLDRALTSKKRKELRRLRSRLAEQGELVFETLRSEGLLEEWSEAFLALESAGWKGRERTALASAPEGQAFFRDAVRRAFAAGSLAFHRLSVGGRPIAMIVNFAERGSAYSFKIAHDEEFARYSPGVMIEIEMMKALEKEQFDFIDSCAAPDHPMINSLWRDRRGVAALNVSGRSARSRLLFRLLTDLERIGELARSRFEQKPNDENRHVDL